jgi:hypothetical protein
MSFGSIFQFAGAALAIVWALVAHQFVIAALIGVHLTGDAIVGFLKPLFGLQQLEKDALRFVKLRGFLLFVGWALMLVFRFAAVNTRLLFVPVTSTGLFLLGAMLVIVGAFTYDEIYT